MATLEDGTLAEPACSALAGKKKRFRTRVVCALGPDRQQRMSGSDDDSDGSDIDPDEMPGEFSSTAENIEPDELPAEWFSEAPDSAPSTPAVSAPTPTTAPSTPAAGSAPPMPLPSLARSTSATPRPPTPPLSDVGGARLSSGLSSKPKGAPRAGGSPDRAGRGTPACKRTPAHAAEGRDEKEEEEKDRADAQISLKAQIDWLVAIEDADPDLGHAHAGENQTRDRAYIQPPAEIEISVAVPAGATEGRRLQGQIEVAGRRRTVDVVLPGGVECGDVLQALHTLSMLRPLTC